ncbi:carboxylesterase/lipase family protein [Maricaulaceae bacterium MS644]
MIRRFTLAAALGALALTACESEPAAPPPTADPALTRAVTGGEIVGYVDGDTGAHVWLGTPFAASAGGDNRWRGPQPVEPWTGARETLTHSAACPQITNALNAEATGTEPGQLTGSEDCLYLDVYAPAPQESGGPRPVMLWIHGGANVWGSASQYDGAQLAVDQGVVVVVVQYRLGPLGFFSHPALEDGASDLSGAANFALLDQIAALEWVRDNAAAFGGDPETVTIFGESAGGHNVAGLLASPLAAGLFHRAIIQSGLTDVVSLADARDGSDVAAVPASRRFTGIDNPGADDLRAAPLQAVYDAYAGDDGLRDMPRMIADGVTIPEDGLIAALSSPATFNAVPIITGTNKDEMKLFNVFDPALSARWFGVIIRTPDPDFFEAASEYQSRLWRALAVDEVAQTLTEGGHEPVFAYRFDWDEGGSLAFMDLSRLLGAAHAMEIPFVFNHFEFFGRLDSALFNDENAQGRQAVAESMGAYWANFARTGDPASAGGPDWPAWENTGRLMRFDTPSDGGVEVIEGRETLEAIAEDLSEDARLTAEQRCFIFERLTTWRASVTELGAPLACPQPAGD